ncbi:MAG: hypothetical protein SPJ79_09035 [Prevotella sp.]|nr:hypothetical protein [Prevotella sp.]
MQAHCRQGGSRGRKGCDNRGTGAAGNHGRLRQHGMAQREAEAIPQERKG